MKTTKSRRLNYSTKSKLSALHMTSEFSKSLESLEDKILSELNEFSLISQGRTIYPIKLVLLPSESKSEMNLHSKLNLLRKILATRGQLRWLCFCFFTPVAQSAYQLSRGKLLLRILASWRTFSEEVLSRLDLKDIGVEDLVRIPPDVFPNPNFSISLNLHESYILESEYNSKLNFSDINSAWLREYSFGKILLWDSRCAIALIKSSKKLQTSPSLREFIKVLPDFKLLIDSRPGIKLRIHSNAGSSLDQRLGQADIGTPDSIANVEIWHQRFLITEGSWLLIDETCSPYLDFVAGHWEFLEQKNFVSEEVEVEKPLSEQTLEIAEAIFLMGRADENWYHLLLDTLPRYLLLDSINPNIPVLVRADLPTTSIELLRRLIPRKLIFVEPHEKISVELLHFIAARSTVFDSKVENGKEQVLFSPKILAMLRDWILDNLTEDETMVFPSKIYLERRAKYRNLINQKRLTSKLAALDFEKIESTEDFFLNQAHYFARADHVIAPGGAVLANIVFMHKGSSVSVIRSWRDSDLQLWKKLAESCEIHFSEAIGIPTYYGRKALARQHSNYFVPARRVKKLLKFKIN
jgi:hypothetical protein